MPKCKTRFKHSNFLHKKGSLEIKKNTYVSAFESIPELPEQSKSVSCKVREIIDNHIERDLELVIEDEEKYWVFVDRLNEEEQKQSERYR